MTILTSVDLPDPLSPSRPTISRRLTLKLIPDSARTSPNDFETFLSSMTGGSPALDVEDSVIRPPAELLEKRGAAPSAPPTTRRLPDFLGRQRRDDVDVLGVDEGARRIDVETREAELLGQADVEDRQVALQIGLLVDHQVLVTLLDRLGRIRRHVEPGEQHLAGLQRRRASVDADVRGQRPVVGDDELDPRIGLHHADKGCGSGVRIGVRRLVDLLIDHLAAGLLDRLDHADGARAAVAALALQTPDESFVAR